MYNVTIVALILTTALLLTLAGVAWYYRHKQGATVFAILQVVSALWAGLTVVGLTTGPGTVRLRIFGMTTGLSLLVIVFWTAFILSYTGRNSWLTARRFGIAVSPLVVGAGLYFAVPTWPLLVGELSQRSFASGTVVTASIGPLGSLTGAYIYLVFLAGLGLVGKTVLEGSRLFVGQALAFTFGSLLTIVASVLVVLGVGIEGYPLTQVALGPQSALWGYAIFGQQFLQVVPAVAEIGERAVFEDLNDGILVVNDDGMIVRTNPRAKAYLNGRDPTGEPIATILDEMGVDTLSDLPTRFEFRTQTLRADSSVLQDWQGEPIGQTVILSDITQVVTREQRLTVLNRVLRHNVRNSMSVVLATGQQLQTQETDELTDHGKALARTAERLNSVSEKALEVNQIFDRPAGREAVSLREIIVDITSRLGEDYPDAAIDTSIEVDSVQTDEQILRLVIEEIVANALEHGGDSPEVRVEAQSTERTVEILVTDDGPGIPQSEIQPLRAGEETALEHTSSFGLWFSKWGMQKVGGSVDFTITETGTQVMLQVPDSGDSTPNS